MWATLLFLVAAVIAAVLLFTMVYYVIMFSDLELDYVNPIELCRRLNRVVVPEMAVHAALSVSLLLGMQLVSAALNLPLLAYHVHRYLEGRHVFEPTDIFRHLAYRKRESMVKLGFFLLSFFYYLYRMVSSLIHTQIHGTSPYGLR